MRARPARAAAVAAGQNFCASRGSGSFSSAWGRHHTERQLTQIEGAAVHEQELPTSTAISIKVTWRKAGISVSAAIETSGLAGVRKDWYRHATHPSVDPTEYSPRLNEGGAVARPAMLVVRESNRVVAVVVAKLAEMDLDFRVRYRHAFRTRGRVLAVADRGAMGSNGPEVATAVAESILTLPRRGFADFANLACVDVTDPMRAASCRSVTFLC